jgi:hypothetical protein
MNIVWEKEGEENAHDTLHLTVTMPYRIGLECKLTSH